MTDYPFISCLCPTFGRTHLLEEAMQSFLDQTYQGRKELIILNDFDQQELVFDHPEVRVINTKERYPTMGEKRHATVEAANADFLTTWDDDDIMLPWHIERMWECYEDHRETAPQGVVEGRYFFHNAADFLSLRNRKQPGVVLFSKDNYYPSGGYRPMNSGQDAELVRDMRIGVEVKRSVSYIYRWGTGMYHLSGTGRDVEGKKSGYNDCYDRLLKKVKQGVVPTGEVVLQPKHCKPYLGLAMRAFRTHKIEPWKHPWRQP